TVGELRGPEKPEAGPVAPSDSYLFCQSSLPVAASRQRRISEPDSRAKPYNLPPANDGVATPSPMVTFHFWVNSLGHSLGALKPVVFPSRLGPRHCGQSWADATQATSRNAIIDK